MKLLPLLRTKSQLPTLPGSAENLPRTDTSSVPLADLTLGMQHGGDMGDHPDQPLPQASNFRVPQGAHIPQFSSRLVSGNISRSKLIRKCSYTHRKTPFSNAPVHYW